MATIKDFNTTDGMSVFVAFHINEDINSNKFVTKLHDEMKGIFGARQSLEISSEENLKKELIYKIQKPVLLSSFTMKEFFQKLQTLFNTTSHLNPHFTQIGSEVIRGRNNK